MRLNFLRLIGPKTPTTPPPAATPETPEQPARSGWEQYLTRDPAQCKTPENPEMSRAQRPYSAGAVHDFLLAWAERAGCDLTEEQTAKTTGSALSGTWSPPSPSISSTGTTRAG